MARPRPALPLLRVGTLRDSENLVKRSGISCGLIPQPESLTCRRGGERKGGKGREGGGGKVDQYQACKKEIRKGKRRSSHVGTSLNRAFRIICTNRI